MTKFLTYIFILLFTFTTTVNGTTSTSLKHTGNDKEQITRATIGAGVIEVGGKVADAELSGLNRDTDMAQEITKDITTGTLDATASIDNRVFTSAGRADIAREHKKAGSFIENVSSNLYNAMAKDTKFTDAMKSIKFEEASKLAVERLLSQDGGKEALEIISGQKQVSPEEKDLALSKFAGEFSDITGVDIGDVKTMLSTEPIGGSFDKDGKDIYLNDNYVFGDTEASLGVFGHEIGHSMYGDDEMTAGYLGSRFADAYTDGLWINGEDYSLGNWNIVDGNSLYVGQNGSDFANVKNRDDCGPLCLTVFGIGAIISGIGAYKGGEARATADYGYLGNNEYMRPDGSHISGEDLKTNLKIYGTMDIGGSILMAGVPFMEGSFSKKGLGGNPFKGKTEKQIEKMFRAKNFEMRGSSNEFDGYVNTKTGRSYHIDFNNRFNEKPHVDINSLYKSNSLKLKKTKYFIDGNIEKIIK